MTFAYPASPDRPVLQRARPGDPGGQLARHRRAERGGQDHPGQAAVPAVRPAVRRHRGRRDRPADLDLESWRRRVTAVFQDFVRFELTLRENVAPRQTAGGGRNASTVDALDDIVSAALAEAGAAGLAEPGHGARQGLRGRHRAVRRAVAAGRPGPGPGRRAARAPGSCCSTSRRPSSTSAARRRSSSGSWRPPGRARRSSSRTGSPRSGTSTGSRWSRTAPSSSSAATTS